MYIYIYISLTNSTRPNTLHTPQKKKVQRKTHSKYRSPEMLLQEIQLSSHFPALPQALVYFFNLHIPQVPPLLPDLFSLFPPRLLSCISSLLVRLCPLSLVPPPPPLSINSRRLRPRLDLLPPGVCGARVCRRRLTDGRPTLSQTLLRHSLKEVLETLIRTHKCARLALRKSSYGMESPHHMTTDCKRGLRLLVVLAVF